MNNALNQAQLNMQSMMGKFTDTFTTKFKDDVTFIKLILDALAFSVGLGSSYFWNKGMSLCLHVTTVLINL
jgi:hypothetical protein